MLRLPSVTAAFLIVSIWAIIFSAPSDADYLEVRRSATIRATPNNNAEILTRPELGEQLPLLDNGEQSNGWYRVFVPSLNSTGWVHRTRGRVYRGEVTGTVIPTISDGMPSLPGDDVMRAHFIDVGQGDATLLEFPCGLLLIDAGGRTEDHTQHLKEYVSKVMERTGDTSIETIFMTHTHTDHNLSLPSIIETFPVSNYVHNGVYIGSGKKNAKWMRDHANDNGRSITDRIAKQNEITSLRHRRGLTDAVVDPLTCADVSLLSGHFEENTQGWPSGMFENGNNKGITIRVDYGEASFLFTGDMQDNAIDSLVDYYKGTDRLDVDVYQSGHHGAENGTNEHLMAAMSADMVVMSMGPDNIHEMWTAWQYGHPRKTLVSMMDRWIEAPRHTPKNVTVATAMKTFFPYRIEDAIFATGWDGTVVIEAKPSGQMVVQTER